jgi:hypothetical protein
MARKPIEDKEALKKPALRISRIVYGRERVGTKVKYLIDPKGQGDKKEIPEKVVLIRWRKRVFPGYTFSGDRLGPNIWRGLAIALGYQPQAHWLKWTDQDIASMLESSRETMGIYKSSVPSAGTIHALIQICGLERLKQIFKRHLDPSRDEIYGTPDLFLFARDVNGRQCMGRFVEVKRPEESFKDGQVEELAFLQSLGLNARVARLIERELPASKGSLL